MKNPMLSLFLIFGLAFCLGLSAEANEYPLGSAKLSWQEPDESPNSESKEKPKSGDEKPDAAPQESDPEQKAKPDSKPDPEQDEDSKPKSKPQDKDPKKNDKDPKKNDKDPKKDDKDPKKDEKDSQKNDKPAAKKPAPKEDGTKYLDQAFELKLDYGTTRDLDRIVQLCDSALAKRLTKKDRKDAEKLAVSSAVEFAQTYAKKIFQPGELDVRWQYYRSLAVPKLTRATELDDTKVVAHLLLARLQALPGGDKQQALESIKRVMAITQNDRQLSQALYVRASLTKDIKAKLKSLNEAINKDPKNLDALLVRAEHFVSKRRLKRALKDYRVWLDAQPENWEARIRVAEALKESGVAFNPEMQSEAISLLDEAIGIKDDFTVPYTMKAEILMMSDQYDEVVAAATSAIKYEPKNVKALRLRATALADLGNYDRAVKDADKIVELQGLSLEGVELRGIIRIQQGKLGEAIKDFERLSKDNPSDARLKEHLASLYNANDQPTKAIRAYDSLLRRTRESIWKDRETDVRLALMQQRVGLLRGRGDAFLSSGQHKKAVDDFEEAVALLTQIRELQKTNGMDVLPMDEVLMNNLAWVLATSPEDEVRDADRAIELATQSAELTDYKEAYILSTLASGYAESGDFERAIEWIEKALEANRVLAEKATDKAETDRRFKSLNAELDSYRNNKPWREKQDVENEKADDDSDDE